MAFQQGLSGLNAAAKSLDVIGNNIANSETVGFKQSQAQFADIYATSLNSVAGKQAGIGVSVSTIAQEFTQGNIETSNNPLDIAINGAGFFRVFNNNQVQYTRNGQFTADKNGFIVNAQGAKLTGYGVDNNGQIVAGDVQPIQIDPSDMKPNATTTIATQLNLNSNTAMPTTVPFNADIPTSYSAQLPVTVYDSLGNSHVMLAYYVQTGENTAGQGTWDVYLASDGKEITAATVAAASQADTNAVTARANYQAAVTAVPLDPTNVQNAALAYAKAAGDAVLAKADAAGATTAQHAAIVAAYDNPTADADNKGFTPAQIDAAITAVVQVPAVKATSLVFNTVGSLDKTAMLAAGVTIPATINLPIVPSTGAKPVLSIQMDFTGSTQIATATAEKKTIQDGYAGGQLTGFAADATGVIVGQYSNGKTKNLGQVVLANFADVNGLTPLGNNVWTETSASGAPIVGVPTTGSLGTLKSGYVETSNVDLTAELVHMITAQRAYQANAQTIKTEDSILQTLVNLR